MVATTSRPWLASCDESGTGGARYYGFGSLWMPWDRRGDFSAALADVCRTTGLELAGPKGELREFKWNKVKPQKLSFYKAVVDMFFTKRWLSFHCLVVQKAAVDRKFHKDFDEARRKHFTMLLANKVKRVAAKHPGRNEFRAWVDPIASSNKKADEVVEAIANNILAQLPLKPRPTLKITTRNSHETPTIQLCDLLLGAVMAAWQGDVESSGKKIMMQHIARHLGWADLRADTHVSEAKFNIWYFYDPTKGPREVETRATQVASGLILATKPSASGR